MREPTEAFIKGLFNAPISFSSLLDEIPHGILLLDPDRNALVMNRALQGLTGFFHTPVRRLPCAHILRSDICILRCPALGMGPASSGVCREGNLINRNRRKIPVRITLSPLKTEDGHTAGFMETVEDLSLLREMGDQHAEEGRIQGLIGQSPEMKRILNMVPAVAQTDSSVLITGETGTGKDLVAEALHRSSSRAKGPFIKVNCGALPETLLESELFGHKKGAFTGAVDNKPGRFKLAHNGTLFLTEIGDLPLNLQVKLLTFLDDRMIHPLGSSSGFQADVRVIAATHRNLEAMVREDRFRRDLLYRLNVVRIELPPLRRRGEDLRVLLDHFLVTFSRKFNKRVRTYSGESLEVLTRFPYPGNVRELRNMVEYAVNVCDTEQIDVRHLPSYILEEQTETRLQNREDKNASPTLLVGPSQSMDQVSWAGMERRMILEALVRAKGRKGRAADLLGWGRSTLWRKMKEHGIES